MTEIQYRELIKPVAQIGLANSTQLRVVKSIGVETIMLKRDLQITGEESTLFDIIKKTTKAHLESSKGATDEQKTQLGPVHTAVAWELLEWVVRQVKDSPRLLTEEKLKDAYEKLSNYTADTAKLAKELKVTDLNQKFRYVRLDKAYKVQNMKLEMGVGPMSAQGSELWECTKYLLIQCAGAVPKMGMAPKGNLERKIAAQLQVMGLSGATWV
eukprot:TRINITY_DN57570_c0_g1_i1.p2 TRINITY_DN57570_c0_g1~~TRINITY_DN57570_c0_g1_i1.p2  ORF type:complete len:213 (+),score=53.17 TRINITY_DN57570_c0_g1_i1:1-639(+)